MTLIVILGIGMTFTWFYVQDNLKAPSQIEGFVTIDILQGDTLSEVSHTLHENGLIQDETVFQLYARYVKLTDFKYGIYKMNTTWDVQKVLEFLNDSTAAISKEALIKIIPGDWAKDVALQIEEKTAYTQAEVLALWNDPAYITTLSQEYSVITPEIITSGVRVLLEGYLMPETYFINPESSIETITEKFISELQAFYDENQALFDSSQFSIHELITLASIVQFEASGLTDMKMVAQVFYNRLALPMRLQSSVTICYSLYEYDTWRDCETNSDIDSPYNTYKYDGLPIGPIDNPSKNAILATLSPTDNDYYYFLADVYGDGTIYYARTYDEHKANVRKYLK